MTRHFLITLLSLMLLPFSAQAADYCSISEFTPDPEDEARLDSGSVGDWNRSFERFYINVDDIAGNTWRYFALEKKPENPKKLILFLHGFLEFANAWEQQLEYFGDDYHAVAIDIKGHRYSSKPDEVNEYDFISLALEMRRLINCLGYDTATVVGHDFGAGIGWSLGMLQPDAIDQLVLMSVPHPYLFGRALLDPDSDQSQRSEYIGYAQGDTVTDRLQFSAVIFSDTSIFNSGFYDDKRILRLMNEVWLPVSGWDQMKHYYDAMPYPASNLTTPPVLPPIMKTVYTVNRPLLLIRGMDDPYFAEEAYTGTEELVPDLEELEWPGGSHFVHHEIPDLNAVIADFIQRHGD